MTHDATVGYWDGVSDVTQPAFPASVGDLDYLSPARRMQVTFGELLSHFRVLGKDGVAEVHLRGAGAPIAKIVRPSPAEFKQQLVYLRSYADLRIDRNPEINVQTSDILSFFGSLAMLNASRRKHTLELLQLTQSLCVSIEMQVKHYCRAPRPIDWTHKVQPVIQTPDHSAFPSGHATESFAIATVLSALDTGKGQVDVNHPAFLLAHRIAANRVVAGVHFPVDSAAGAFLGCQIGDVINRMAAGGACSKAGYGPGEVALAGDQDFLPCWFRNHYKPAELEGAAPTSAALNEMVGKAQGEWSTASGGSS
ncbi:MULTISPECIES: phosphatase PAP2 family protein [unclassified Roseovarius]|uniref:phosphatase PAP2 family protein n=1 Tax=unclassified Roseovarius TaxID=2614913 RepID=UPI00273EBA88|nr:MULTISPECIES: phosphatase PAP2 family protein [unclassified Roseovarius]